MFGQTTNPQDQESTFKLKLGLIVSVIKITLYSLNGAKTEPSFVFVGQINLKKLNLYKHFDYHDLRSQVFLCINQRDLLLFWVFFLRCFVDLAAF